MRLWRSIRLVSKFPNKNVGNRACANSVSQVLLPLFFFRECLGTKLSSEVIYEAPANPCLIIESQPLRNSNKRAMIKLKDKYETVMIVMKAHYMFTSSIARFYYFHMYVGVSTF